MLVVMMSMNMVIEALGCSLSDPSMVYTHSLGCYIVQYCVGKARAEENF